MTKGEKIQKLREKYRYSQKDLATILNVSTGIIAEWESGETEPIGEDIEHLCEAFSISHDFWLEDKQIPKVKNNRTIKWLFLILFVILGVIASFLVIKKIVVPNQKYKQAIVLLEDKKYVEAYELFQELEGFKDASRQMKRIKPNVYHETIKASDVGEIVKLGSYEQDDNQSNGKEEIEWIVLSKENDMTLLISRYALDCKKYHYTYGDSTWEISDLRKWINTDFFNNAFGDSEQKMLQSITLRNNDNSEYGVDGGNDTKDKVFILSVEEIEKYFSSETERVCMPTQYAIEKGAGRSDNGTCCWWLRSPGSQQGCAMRITTYGDYTNNYWVGNFETVRPAIWVKNN